jgi:hypothetical protein
METDRSFRDAYCTEIVLVINAVNISDCLRIPCFKGLKSPVQNHICETSWQTEEMGV